jgi:hypothetical protein
MSSSPRVCGSCSLCCKVLPIAQLDKPAGVWCAHFRVGVGCSIHGAHPSACRAFQCLWLNVPSMPDQLRPDRCKVVLGLEDGGSSLYAYGDPADPGAWRRNPIHGQLRLWAAEFWDKGRTVWAKVGDHAWLIAPDRDIDLGEIRGPHVINYKPSSDGAITITILPPLPEGEAYAPETVQAALDSGQGRRIVSPSP